MNKTHRLIWNDVRQTWIVAHEAATTSGKPASPKKRLLGALATALITSTAIAAPPAPTTLPTGGQLMAGQASIRQAGNALTIAQSSQKAILNWNSFSIGSNASVSFQQPNASAVALNRVTGNDPSAIYGALNANGQVFLINANGVLFGQGAKVDVGGLVASSLNITNEDFLNGNYRFTRDGATAGVTNQGELYGQYIALLAPEVRNEGLISARQGTVALAAGEAVTLGLTNNQSIDVAVDPAEINTLVANQHLVQADEGTVILSAQSANQLLGNVVNTGAIAARGITTDGGTVRLLASSTVEHSGSITVDGAKVSRGGTAILLANLANPTSKTTVSGTISAKGGSEAGDGGFIETSGTHLSIADSARIDTSAPNGKTGRWLLDPVNFTIAASGGDITGTALGAALAASDVTISTTAPLCSVSAGSAPTCGSGSGSDGDIFVNDTISWSANALTLSADRHILINSALTVTGTGGLNLKFDQADGFVGNYFVNAPVNLANTTTFTTQAGTFFSADTYTVLVDQAGIMGMTTNNPAVRYVLGNNLQASGTWTPVGTNLSPYLGVFDGLGHTVDSISVTGTSDYQGMFGFIGAPALVQNIGVTHATVNGTRYVGALIGDNESSVYHSFATGTVTASTANNTPITAVGGLVGLNNGVIDRSRSGVTVTATSDTGGNTYAGGGNDGGIGGIAGVSHGTVGNSVSTGSVSGLRDVGGLVGWAAGQVVTSYATGVVTLAGNGSDRIHVGGLIGDGAGMLAVGNSFWDKETTQQNASFGSGAGYSMGLTTAQMKTAANFTSATAANGNVDPSTTFPTWDSAIWTLANDSYPSLAFPSSPYTTTMVVLSIGNASKVYGDNNPALPTITAQTGDCSDCISIGGWGSYLTTATNAGSYLYSTPNLLTLYYKAGTTASDYAITYTADANNGNFEVVQRTVTLSASKQYDGTTTLSTVSIGNTAGKTLAYTGATANDAHVATNDKYISAINLQDGTGANAGLAANYRVDYIYNATGNAVNITAKPLTVTGLLGVNKVYDTTATATLSGSAAIASGATNATDGKYYSTDTVSLTGAPTASFGSTHVDAGTQTLSVAGLSVNNNTDYTLSPVSVTASITPKALTVTGLLGTNKVYDATDTATVGGTAALTNGAANASDGKFYSTDTVSLTGAPMASFGSTHVSAGTQTLTVVGLGVSNTDYSLSPVSVTAAITPKALDILGLSAPTSVAIGATSATLSGTATLKTAIPGGTGTANDGAPYANDAITLTGRASGVIASPANAGGQTVTVTANGLSLTGNTHGDYTLKTWTGTSTSSYPDVSASAQPIAYFWDGGAATDNWSLAANWLSDRLPVTGSTVTISANYSVIYDINNLTLAQLTSSSPITFLADKKLTLTGAGYFRQPLNLEAGSLLTAQGTLNLSVRPSLAAGAKVNITQSGDNILTIANTSYTVINDLTSLRTMTGNVAIGADIAAQQGAAAFTARDVQNLAGLGHTISNLSGNGFIAVLSRTASDIGMVNVNFTGSGSGLGGLVNSAEASSSIYNSYATGTVSGANVVGGLVGDNSGTVSHSYATSTVSGTNVVGGLIGGNSGTVSYSYATGNVSGTYYVGGLVAANSYYISLSYASGTVSGTDSVGGLVGNGLGNATNSYMIGVVNGTLGSSRAGIVRLSADEAVLKQSYSGWDFNTVWDITEGSSTPWLRALPRPDSVTYGSKNTQRTQTVVNSLLTGGNTGGSTAGNTKNTATGTTGDPDWIEITADQSRATIRPGGDVEVSTNVRNVWDDEVPVAPGTQLEARVQVPEGDAEPLFTLQAQVEENGNVSFDVTFPEDTEPGIYLVNIVIPGATDQAGNTIRRPRVAIATVVVRGRAGR